jgi:GTP-binding protein
VPLRSVVIVGRPNVGKSTLFNRLIRARRAVVHETPGVTRDRLIERADWAGHQFLLVDTGGIVPFGEAADARFDRLVTEISQDAIAAADVVIFLVDGRTGPTEDDLHIAVLLRRSEKPVVLAVNKTEKESTLLAVSEFFKLGLGEPMAISALHGLGVGDIMDLVVEGFPPASPEEHVDCKIAIVGRPNVGKSTLLNQLVGRQEALVSEIPGTTRDAVHTDLRWHGRTLRLVDTAGLRRKSKVTEAVEAFSAMRTLRAVEECDVAVLMVDAMEGAVTQEAKIAGHIHDSGRGVVVAFNKWDLVEKDQETYRQVWDRFLQQVPFLSYAPWFTFSALSKQRLGRILETVWEVHEERQRRVETAELNRFLEQVVGRQPPRHHAGGAGRIYYATQVDKAPPTFLLSVNNPSYFARNYLRFLNNQIRKRYGFTGCRIFIKLKKH